MKTQTRNRAARPYSPADVRAKMEDFLRWMATGGQYANCSRIPYEGRREMLTDAHKLRSVAKAKGCPDAAGEMAFAIVYRMAYYGTLPPFDRYGRVQPWLLKPLARFSADPRARGERCLACDPENEGYECAEGCETSVTNATATSTEG